MKKNDLHDDGSEIFAGFLMVIMLFWLIIGTLFVGLKTLEFFKPIMPIWPLIGSTSIFPLAVALAAHWYVTIMILGFLYRESLGKYE